MKLAWNNKSRIVIRDACGHQINYNGPALSHDFQAALNYFAFLVECHSQHRLVLEDSHVPANLTSIETTIRLGKKYAKVDVGTSGRYMVDLVTGDIWGIKAYGVVHTGHHYGTLATVEDWYWGTYRAVRIAEGTYQIC